MPEAVIAARFFPLAHPEQALVKSRTPEELAADVAKFVTLLPKIGVTSFLVGQATDKNKTLREQVIDLVTFFIVLQNLQRTCAEWRAPPYDQAKRLCAGRALGLLQDLSTKLPTSGSARSPYRAVTSLLFEAATGQPGADLERACEAVLKERRDQAR